MLETAMIFGSNMVLQRHKDIKVWGTGTSGELITGRLKGMDTVVTETRIGTDGNWMLVFPPQEAGRGMELSISNGTDTLVFNNISIGEVWLAGGQSNMEYFLEHDAEKESVFEGNMNPYICFFDYPEVSYEGQLEEHDYSRFGVWRTCTKKYLPYFSAVGYYFARNLQKNLDIPVGIIGCNWGGTPACSWIDPVFLKDNKGKAWIESYEEAVKDIDLESYKAEFHANPRNDRSNPLEDISMSKVMYPGLTRKEQEEFLNTNSEDMPMMPQVGPYYEKRPGGLYEVMLKKVAPYSIRGVLWYQGESDEEKAGIYSIVFGKLIECWRKLWSDQLPFLFVQLAPFCEWLGCTGKNFPEVRKQQELVSKTVPDTWMISSGDAGMQWDIHPKHKKSIGNRLALLARGHVYGENLLCDSPEFFSAERISRGIRINFSHDDGLYLKGEKVNALVVTDVFGKEIIPVEVTIQDDGLLIMGEFPEKLTISFAQSPYYEVNVYNKEENPLKPFEVTV